MEFGQYSFCSPQVLHMEEGDDLLDCINKTKVLADHLACLEVFMKSEDVMMALLKNL